MSENRGEYILDKPEQAQADAYFAAQDKRQLSERIAELEAANGNLQALLKSKFAHVEQLEATLRAVLGLLDVAAARGTVVNYIGHVSDARRLIRRALDGGK